MRQLLEDPDVSQYHIVGFGKLTAACKRYAVAAALVGYVPDAVLWDLMEDDRVAPKAEHLMTCLHSEIQYLADLPPLVYENLAILCQAASGPELQADILEAAHSAAAYVHHKILKPAAQYPWRLAAGDIDANLTTVVGLAAEQVALLDDTTKKIHH